jgi:LuxR family maltose regulon positive regulatory protein
MTGRGSMVAMAEPLLLSTKYVPPPLPPGILSRAELEASLAVSRGLVLVSAPPGYGKTTLVARWTAAAGRPTAWLTLDAADGDPAIFLAYLLAAIRRVRPDVGADVEEAVRSAPDSPSALTPLVNALGGSREPLTIVLDDYHAIRSGHVHDLVAFLVRHAPAGLLIAILSREDPALPLARARARGQLTEIRAAQLRFSREDAARFLRETMELDLPDGAGERLADQTEGWITGLQLAGLSLRGRDDPGAFIDGFGALDRYILDYLVDEAIARQPPEVRAFLEETSILERLTGSLCDALTGRTGGAEMLIRLEGAGLFLTPLDDRREWYAYHGLFAELLRSALLPARRLELHRLAAEWFAARADGPAAVRHALAGADPDRAAGLIESVSETTIARGEFQTLIGWGDALPTAALHERPTLRVALALARFFSGDIRRASADVRALREAPSPLESALDGRVACLEAWLANRADRADTEALARRAIDLIPEEDAIMRCLAFGTLGEALIGGEIGEAVVAYEQAHRLALVTGRSTLRFGSVYSLAMADVIRGRRRDAEARCRTTLAELADRQGTVAPSAGMIELALGVALFEADDLPGARASLELGSELCERAGLRATMLGAAEWPHVLVLHMAGETDAAWRKLDATRRDGERLGLTRVRTGMRLLAAELLLREGDPVAALGRLEAAPIDADTLLGSVRDRARQTSARVLALLDRHDEALAILEPLADEQRAAGRLGRLVGTLVLSATARDRSGDAAGSKTALGDAVTLAADEGYRRPFLETGAPGAALLAGVRSAAPGFVDDLVARHSALGSGAVAPTEQAPPRRVPLNGGPVEALSERELEILRLVAGGLSNDEIGRALYITTGTAKWHVHNLIGKLGGRDRTSMLARARSAGLL